VIDGGVFFGRNPSTGAALDEKRLVSFLDGYGLSSAVVSSYESIFSDVKEGNSKLVALARRHPERVLPAATLSPASFDAYADPAYLARLKKDGVRILSVLSSPRYYEPRFGSPALAAALKEADRLGFAFQLGVDTPAELVEIERALGFLKGPVLVRWMRGRAYHGFSDTLAIARRHSNWFFDVGSLTPSGAIGRLVETVGAERLFFASNAPESLELAAHCLVQNALSGEAREAVYGGTLARVLGLPKPRSFDARAWGVRFAPVMTPAKIDTHWHVDGWNLIEPEKDDRFFAREFDRFNYTRALVSSIRALNGDLKAGNRGTFSLADRDPRVAGLVVVDPTRPEESLAEIARYAKNRACVGVKTIQDLYGLGLDAPAYAPILTEAKKRRLTVMAHIPGMAAAAKKWKTLRFVCAHATYRRVGPLFASPNVFFDVATSHADVVETRLDALVREAGDDRVLFASDAQLMNPAWTLGKIAHYGFTKKTLVKIFSSNALAAFPKLKGR